MSSNTHAVDTSLERSDIEAYLIASGYWGDENLRHRHGYVLSPSAYMLSPLQERDLDRLAKKTYAAVKTLNDRLVDIASGAMHPTHEDGRFLKLANNSARSLLRPADGERRIPPVLKVDLVQDAKGRFFIAEVDVYNPRGFGFAALLEDSLPPGFQYFRYPGVSGFIDCFKGVTADRDIEWHILVSEFERYYDTAYRMLVNACERRGMKLHTIRECDLGEKRRGLSGPMPGLLSIPDTLNKYPDVRDELLAMYRAGTIRTLYSPLSYLGSKGFLPFLRGCEGMDEFIPPTSLIGKRCTMSEDTGKEQVLKATVSSGMKDVLFSDLDPGLFEQTLDRARGLKNPSWILQEQVKQEPTPIPVFEVDGTRVTKDYYLRTTAYISEDGIVDAQITGRPDRKVHGAPDCIMLPVLLCRDLC